MRRKKESVENSMADKEHSERMHEQRARDKESALNRYREYCSMHATRPLNRRDFLSAGIISLGASAWLPQLAFAQSQPCPDDSMPSGGPAPAAFIDLSAAGGAMFAADWIPTDQGGQLLSSYDLMGLGRQPNTVSALGTLWTEGSPMLAGIQSVASAQTLANTALVKIPVRSGDDTNNNAFHATGMVLAAGRSGALAVAGARQQTGTLFRHRSAFSMTVPNPLDVRNVVDLTDALSGTPRGPLGFLDQNGRISVSRMIERLTAAQGQSLAPGGSQTIPSDIQTVADLTRCASEKNTRLAAATPPSIDARDNNDLAQVWGVGGVGDNDATAIEAAIVTATLMDQLGVGALSIGGADYHNGTRDRGDGFNNEFGVLIGRMLESARIIGRKLFIWVTTDGSCVSEQSDNDGTPWTSDRGTAGMAAFIVYDPSGPVSVAKHQLGHFTEGQVADNQFVTGGSPELAAAAAFANYAAFSGASQWIDQVIPSVLTPLQRDQILVIG